MLKKSSPVFHSFMHSPPTKSFSSSSLLYSPVKRSSSPVRNSPVKKNDSPRNEHKTVWSCNEIINASPPNPSCVVSVSTAEVLTEKLVPLKSRSLKFMPLGPSAQSSVYLEDIKSKKASAASAWEELDKQRKIREKQMEIKYYETKRLMEDELYFEISDFCTLPPHQDRSGEAETEKIITAALGGGKNAKAFVESTGVGMVPLTYSLPPYFGIHGLNLLSTEDSMPDGSRLSVRHGFAVEIVVPASPDGDAIIKPEQFTTVRPHHSPFFAVPLAPIHTSVIVSVPVPVPAPEPEYSMSILMPSASSLFGSSATSAPGSLSEPSAIATPVSPSSATPSQAEGRSATAAPSLPPPPLPTLQVQQQTETCESILLSRMIVYTIHVYADTREDKENVEEKREMEWKKKKNFALSRGTTEKGGGGGGGEEEGGSIVDEIDMSGAETEGERDEKVGRGMVNLFRLQNNTRSLPALYSTSTVRLPRYASTHLLLDPLKTNNTNNSNNNSKKEEKGKRSKMMNKTESSFALPPPRLVSVDIEKPAEEN